MDLRGASKPPPIRKTASNGLDRVACFSKGARVIARTNTSWCKCGEIGLIVGIELEPRNQKPGYWVLFQDGGYSMWSHDILSETLAITNYIDPAARDNMLVTEDALQQMRINGSFRF